MNLAPINSAIHNSHRDASRYFAAHLRTEARASGWPEHIVRSMKVSYTPDNGFQAKFHPGHHEEAMNLEYGTLSTQPTAALRRASNRTHEVANFMLARLSSHLEGFL